MTHVDVSPAWSERITLFPKRFDYMFSLAFSYDFKVSPADGSPVPLEARPSKPTVDPWEDAYWDTFHVLGEEFIRTADGVEHQYLRARVVLGKDSLAIRDEGTVSLDGTLLLETDTPDPLSMAYQGVLTLDGGTLSFLGPPPAVRAQGPSGRSVIASTQAVTNPKYRWLVQNRLIGVGRLHTTNDGYGGWRLDFDYDFYIAS